MRIALGADEKLPLIDEIRRFLEERGHALTSFGAATEGAAPWGRTAIDVAREVVSGRVDSGVVCCWTGTGVSIAANKVSGARAALCADAETARGARKWNDANVLALSLRRTSTPVAYEILDAWLSEPYGGTEGESLDALKDAERR